MVYFKTLKSVEYLENEQNSASIQSVSTKIQIRSIYFEVLRFRSKVNGMM